MDNSVSGGRKCIVQQVTVYDVLRNVLVRAVSSSRYLLLEDATVTVNKCHNLIKSQRSYLLLKDATVTVDKCHKLIKSQRGYVLLEDATVTVDKCHNLIKSQRGYLLLEDATFTVDKYIYQCVPFGL